MNTAVRTWSLIALCLAAGVVGLFMFARDRRELQSLQRQIHLKREWISNAAQYSDEIQAERDRLRRVRAFNYDFQSKLPPPDAIVKLEHEITQKAESLGLRLHRLKPGLELRGDRLIACPLEMELEGAFQETLKLLDEIEVIDAPMRQQSLHMWEQGGTLRTMVELIVFVDSANFSERAKLSLTDKTDR